MQRPGDTRLARLFFRGQYAEILAATFDDPDARVSEQDDAFVLGALTFVGRVAEARAWFDAWRTDGRDERAVAAARFFLGLAYARAGDFVASAQLLVAGARARARSGDPWCVALLFQGLACQRYFTGRLRAAARHALRARQAAFAAGFGWAQLLSVDLRAHALVQLGHYRAGTALFDQARALAERLGYARNAHAIDVSTATYAGRFEVRGVAERIEALLARRSHDSYSERALLSELAVQHALRGRATEAKRCLALADADALRGDARRARLSNLVVRLHVTRWTEGAHTCARLLPEALRLADDADAVFRAELLGFEALVAGALGDRAAHDAALDRLRELAASTQQYRARAVLEQHAGKAGTGAFVEDELTPLLAEVTARGDRAVGRLLSLGLLGPIPEALGLVPDRRLILLGADNALLVEDHGDLHVVASPPRWCAALLRILASGDASKEAIVTGLWGLRSYKPERHDAIVRTTIHRLRALLGPHGAPRVANTPSGYGVTCAVHIVGAAEALDAPMLYEEAPDSVYVARPRFDLRRAGHESAVLDAIARRGEASVRDVARDVALSESTVLRALRGLLRGRQVARTGRARASRYHVVQRRAPAP